VPTLDIAEVRRGSRKCTLAFDGETVRTTSRDVVRTLELSPGEYPEPSVVIAQVDEAEPTVALERALRLLNYRERSVAEMRARLLDDGYPANVIDTLIARFLDLQLLDDSRYAACLVRSKRLAGWGRSRISLALKAKGVSQEDSDRALGDGSESEYDRAFEIALRRPPADRAGVERTLARLVRKGFSFDVALRAAKSALSASEVEECPSEDSVSLDDSSCADVP